MTRLEELAKRITDLVLEAPGYERAPILVAQAVRVFMREFDQQISRADEPLGDWLDAQVSR